MTLQLDEIERSLQAVDEKMNNAFSNIDNPTQIVDRVHDLSVKHSVAAREIEFFERNQETAEGLKTARAGLKDERGKTAALISDIINNKVRKLVDVVYDEQRKSPKLNITDSSYTFVAVEDTGTGKAYSSMALLDIAILKTTALPFIIHDSILFKSVETEAVAKLVGIYDAEEKQTFIAIDEIQKYGEFAESILLRRSVIQLTNDNQLYVKDWRV